MAKQYDFDCAVIGAGPAGLVSTIYLRRFRRTVLLVNSGKPRAAWIPKTHNLLGYDEGISGKELLARMGRQVRRLGVETVEAQARLQPRSDGVKIQLGEKSAYVREVILATGVEDVQPELENLDRLRAHGLLRYCPICDAYEYRNRSIAVLVADEHGIRKALFMLPYARRLIIVQLTRFPISAKLRRQLLTACAEVFEGPLLAIEPNITRQGSWIHVQAHKPIHVRTVYVELGTQVRDQAYAHLDLNRTDQGFIEVGSRQKTSVEHIWAAGDCVDGLSQIHVAAGQAAIAATAIHNQLRAPYEEIRTLKQRLQTTRAPKGRICQI